METAQLEQLGCLKGHGGWVTALATTHQNDEVLVSASRDKSLIVWKLTRGEGEGLDDDDTDGVQYGYPQKLLAGHTHFVEDVIISRDGSFCLSGSWDGTLRLWELETGKTARVFVGHDKDVLSVAFSADNRQIVSGSRDKTIKLWNTLGECKFTITDDCHTEWVSCVRFSPQPLKVVDASGAPKQIPLVVSCGWDKLVKVWNLSDCKLKNNLVGHTGYLNTVTVSPDGSLCASGGKDGQLMLWSLQEDGRFLYKLDAGDVIHALVFSPNRYWLCAATSSCIKIWDLETKIVVDELKPEFPAGGKKRVQTPYPISLCWSHNGTTLFSGYTDSVIRVWGVGGIELR